MRNVLHLKIANRTHLCKIIKFSINTFKSTFTRNILTFVTVSPLTTMNFPFFAFVKNNLLSSIKTFGILFAYTTIGYTIFSIIKSSFLYWLNGPSFAPLNKHCYITGGSQGLGKSLAINLAKMGANVTIVARNKELLHQVVVELNAAKINPTQKFKAIVADVTNLDQSIKAIADATSFMGICPEYVFTIAGASVPGLLLELNTSVYKSQMDLNYMGSVYTVKECVRLMVANKVKGKIVLCSSLAALVGFIGYSAYTPTKCAIKGFNR